MLGAKTPRCRVGPKSVWAQLPLNHLCMQLDPQTESRRRGDIITLEHDRLDADLAVEVVDVAFLDEEVERAILCVLNQTTIDWYTGFLGLRSLCVSATIPPAFPTLLPRMLSDALAGRRLTARLPEVHAAMRLL